MLTEEREVTSMEEIQKKVKGQVIGLPGWDEDEVYMKIRRPSLTGLVKTGKVPNDLLGVAEQAIQKGSQVDSAENFKKMCDLLYIVAEQSIVEPSFEEVEPYLTDEQLFFVFSYVMQGVRGLRNFRQQQGRNSEVGSSFGEVGKATK